MLNGLWLGFPGGGGGALARWLIGGDATVFAAMVESLFAMAKLAVEVMVLLFGTLTLWLGFLRIAEKAGLVERLAVLLGPLFRRLMPEVPPGHPAIGLITLNFAANGLGLDNAATPIGLKAMKALQELNPSSTTASNAQILFLVLNASSLTLLPVTIFMYRAQQGAADPTLVFLPILLATSASTLAGLLSVALMQRLRLWDPVVLAYLIPGALLLAGFMAVLGTLSATALAQLSSLLGNLTLFSLIVLFLIVGALKKVPVYESFVEGRRKVSTSPGTCCRTWSQCFARLACCAPPGRWKWYSAGYAGRSRGWAGTAASSSAAHRAGQAVLRQRGAGDAAGDHADPRRRQFPGAGRRHRAGQYRDHLLRARRLFRLGRPAARAPRGGLRADRGPGRGHRLHRRVLLVLRLRSPGFDVTG